MGGESKIRKAGREGEAGLRPCSDANLQPLVAEITQLQGWSLEFAGETWIQPPTGQSTGEGREGTQGHQGTADGPWRAESHRLGRGGRWVQGGPSSPYTPLWFDTWS